MQGRPGKEDAEKRDHEQSKKYPEGRHIGSGFIPDVSGQGRSQTADERVERHRKSHNFRELAPAEIIGKQISHGYGLDARADSKNNGVCKHHGRRVGKIEDRETN